MVGTPEFPPDRPMPDWQACAGHQPRIPLPAHTFTPDPLAMVPTDDLPSAAEDISVASGETAGNEAGVESTDSSDADASVGTKRPVMARIGKLWPVSIAPLPSVLIQSGLMKWWVSLYLGLWLARLGTHIGAGYLRLPPRAAGVSAEQRQARRTLRSYTWLEAATAVILLATLFTGSLPYPNAWRIGLLVVSVLAVTLIPGSQAALVEEAGVETGGAWIQRVFGTPLRSGSDAPPLVVLRLFTARGPGMRVSNLSRVIAIGLTVMLLCLIGGQPVEAGYTSMLAKARGGGSSKARATVTVMSTVSPSPQPTVTVTLIPPPPPGSKLKYDDYCKHSAGGPVPAADAPTWARTALYDLFLGEGAGPDAGVGAVAAGCAGLTHVASDYRRMSAWTIGTSPVTGEIKSVATFSIDLGKCIVLDSAALAVAKLVERGMTIACSGRHAFGTADGDAYLIDTGEGTYAYLRNSQYAPDGSVEPYLELPPGVSDAWAKAERDAQQVLIPVKVSATSYVLHAADGRLFDRRIDVHGMQVRLVSRHTAVPVTDRAQLSWLDALS